MFEELNELVQRLPKKPYGAILLEGNRGQLSFYAYDEDLKAILHGHFKKPFPDMEGLRCIYTEALDKVFNLYKDKRVHCEVYRAPAILYEQLDGENDTIRTHERVECVQAINIVCKRPKYSTAIPVHCWRYAPSMLHFDYDLGWKASLKLSNDQLQLIKDLKPIYEYFQFQVTTISGVNELQFVTFNKQNPAVASLTTTSIKLMQNIIVTQEMLSQGGAYWDLSMLTHFTRKGSITPIELDMFFGEGRNKHIRLKQETDLAVYYYQLKPVAYI